MQYVGACHCQPLGKILRSFPIKAKDHDVTGVVKIERFRYVAVDLQLHDRATGFLVNLYVDREIGLARRSFLLRPLQEITAVLELDAFKQNLSDAQSQCLRYTRTCHDCPRSTEVSLDGCAGIG